MNNPETIGQALNGLTGHGIYSLDMVIEQFPRYGFTYMPDSDKLVKGYFGTRLGSGTLEQIQRSIAQDAEGGILDTRGVRDDERFVDALALSEAVFRLLMPGIPPRSEVFVNRNKGFRANVAAILEWERQNKEVPQ